MVDGKKDNKKELNPFEITVKLMDHNRRIEYLEGDMKTVKPIIYDTSASVKRIEKSVEKMETNSEKTRGYIQAAVITGIVGVLVLAVKTLLGLEGWSYGRYSVDYWYCSSISTIS